MRTYRAELAPWRMEPLVDEYVELAKKNIQKIKEPGPKSYAYEVMCPYCGNDEEKTGTVRIGAKDQQEGVSMTRKGYDVPEAGDRDTEILVIHCKECGASIDPLAYLSPAVFWADKEGVEIWEEDEPAY